MLLRTAVTTLVLALACARVADAADLWVNPGTMGPNALPPQPGDRAWVPEEVQFRIEAAGQLTRGGDRSAVPAFRIEAPFGRWVSILSEGRPMELWRVSPQTAAEWETSRDAGVSQGDLLFGVKFVLFHGGRKFPALAVRNVTKTTTGKDYYDRRFTNAPAYLIDALVSQRIPAPEGWDIEAWGSVGFFAWQQGPNGQNDALSWSTTLFVRAPVGHAARMELRGYQGWQTGDRPLVATVGVDWRLSKMVDLALTVNGGLRDPRMVDVRLGVVLRLPRLFPVSIGGE